MECPPVRRDNSPALAYYNQYLSAKYIADSPFCDYGTVLSKLQSITCLNV